MSDPLLVIIKQKIMMEIFDGRSEGLCKRFSNLHNYLDLVQPKIRIREETKPYSWISYFSSPRIRRCDFGSLFIALVDLLFIYF